jgi:hypothetical protein
MANAPYDKESTVEMVAAGRYLISTVSVLLRGRAKGWEFPFRSRTGQNVAALFRPAAPWPCEAV